MRNPLTGEVRMGSGMIHAHGTHYRPTFAASKARAAIPVDERPLHVRMRAARDGGATWDRVADEFGFRTGDAARKHVLAAEREVRR